MLKKQVKQSFLGGGVALPGLAKSLMLVFKTLLDSALRACGEMEFKSPMAEGKKECFRASVLELGTRVPSVDLRLIFGLM